MFEEQGRPLAYRSSGDFQLYYFFTVTILVGPPSLHSHLRHAEQAGGKSQTDVQERRRASVDRDKGPDPEAATQLHPASAERAHRRAPRVPHSGPATGLDRSLSLLDILGASTVCREHKRRRLGKVVLPLINDHHPSTPIFIVDFSHLKSNI